jgi:hypothetical protein
MNAKKTEHRRKMRKDFPGLIELQQRRFYHRHRRSILEKMKVQHRTIRPRLNERQRAQRAKEVRELRTSYLRMQMARDGVAVTPENMKEYKLRYQICRSRHTFNILAAASVLTR